MPLEVTADPTAAQYATIDTALSAAELWLGGAAFVALDDVTQDKHLITASLDIDSIGGERVDGYTVEFLGTRATPTQQLEWPRIGTAYSDDAWPQKLVDATIALAFYNAALLAKTPTADVVNADPQAFRLKRKKTGPIEREWFPAPNAEATVSSLARFPGLVQRLLASLVEYVPIGAAWGSATVSRGS